MLGLPEHEPIYTEEEVVETSKTSQVEPDEGVAPVESSQVVQSRLQVISGSIQPSTENADHQTHDEVVTDPMSSRIVVCHTDVHPGQELLHLS